MDLEACYLDVDDDSQVQFMFNVRSQPKVVDNLFCPPPLTIGQHREWLRKNHGISRFIYLLKDGSKVFCMPEVYENFVGYYQVVPNEEKKEVELGWVIHSDCHGKGYGKKAVSLSVSLTVEKYSGWKVFLEVKDSNKAAISIYERNGFVDVGTFYHGSDLVRRMELR